MMPGLVLLALCCYLDMFKCCAISSVKLSEFNELCVITQALSQYVYRYCLTAGVILSNC